MKNYDGFHVGKEFKTHWRNACNHVTIVSHIAFFDMTQHT